MQLVRNFASWAAVGLLVVSCGCVEFPETISGGGTIDSTVPDAEMTFVVESEIDRPDQEGQSCSLQFFGSMLIEDCAAGFTAEFVANGDENLETCGDIFEETFEDFAACLIESDCYRVGILAGRYEATPCLGNRGNGKGEGRNNKKGNGKAKGHDKNPVGGNGQSGDVSSSGCMLVYLVDNEDDALDAVALVMIDDESGEVFYENCGYLNSGALDSTPLQPCNGVIVNGDGTYTVTFVNVE